ncbi:hypothetical protein FRC91_16260 [Bradymonadales bacterium TMQ1]|nr:hypothetical protein FRC91_16260 [Bradymonadales bacterium TMQ1]
MWRGAWRGGAWLGVMLIAVVMVACSSPGDDARTDGGERDSGEHDAGGSEDVGEDADGGGLEPPRCQAFPQCADDERVVDCQCVSNLDRRCSYDDECRPEETCQEIEAGRPKVCIYEPPVPRGCPGEPGCEAGAQEVLLAGAASMIITPESFKAPPAEGESDPGWEDDAMWIAGFSSGRPALFCPEERIGCDGPECCISKFAHDDLKSQIVVLRQDETTVAMVALDVVGFFHTDVQALRARIPAELGIDHLIVASTHNHEAPDTAGQWGPGSPLPNRSGRNPAFIERILSQTLLGLEQAVANLEPAQVHAAVLKPGVEGLAISDSRPPYIFDDNLPVVRVSAVDSGETIATLLSFANHPEVLWSGNQLITADYPHYVRKYIEQGLDAVQNSQGQELKPALDGLGGVTVFFVGALGGLINPGRGGALNYADEAFEGEQRHTFDAADAVGQRLAMHVLRAHRDGELLAQDSPALSFRTVTFLTPIENTIFQLAAFGVKLIERDVYNAAQINTLQFYPGPPQVLTEASVVGLGSVAFFTAPGEVFPESLVGGYPGRTSVWDPVIGDVEERRAEAVCGPDGMPLEGGDEGESPCVVRPDQVNPPDFGLAPRGPYIYERLGSGALPFFIGLGGDFLGYMVPSYDYEGPQGTQAAPGSHYEETNGVNGQIQADWEAALDRLLTPR